MNKSSMKRKVYPPWLKLQIISEVSSGQLSKEAARRKYGIGGKSTILKWMRLYNCASPAQTLISLGEMKPRNQTTESERAESPSPAAEIASLKAELTLARCEAALYKRMVELASKRYNIAIEKK